MAAVAWTTHLACRPLTGLLALQVLFQFVCVQIFNTAEEASYLESNDSTEELIDEVQGKR